MLLLARTIFTAKVSSYGLSIVCDLDDIIHFVDQAVLFEIAGFL